MTTDVSLEEKIAWLRLYRTERIGPATLFRLIARYGTAVRVLDVLPDLMRKGGRARPRLASEAEALEEMAAIEAIGASMLVYGDDKYPKWLVGLDTAPFLIVKGRAELLLRPMIAIVGSRNASLNGRRLAKSIAADLAAAGLVVISGLARGIDAAAHEGALAGGTVAVLAGGLDVVYPPEHRALQDRISAEGCLVGEMPPGFPPTAAHFPRRNRLISGLAQGVLVVEAAPASGSLITARYALDQGRELFAVPGFPGDPRSAGPNGLLRDGAILVESAADILAALPGWLKAEKALMPQRLPPAPRGEGGDKAMQAEMLRLLGATAVTVDEIIRECQLSPAAASQALLELELAGRLARHPGNKVSLLG